MFVGKDKAKLITYLSSELGMSKKEVLENALLSYADIQKRFSDINDSSSVMSQEDFNKAVAKRKEWMKK